MAVGQQYHQNMVHFLRGVVALGDAASGVAVSIGHLPAGAVVVQGGAVVTEAFDSGTSDVLDIGFRNAGDGTVDDPDEFATDLDISAAGMKAADEIATAADLEFPDGAEIIATWTATGTAATAGRAIVWVGYLVDNGETV